MSIYIYRGGVITGMQGPCDTGFHIPTTDERLEIYNIGVSLGAWTASGGTYFSTYLKLPFAGYRYNNTSIYNVDVGAYYHSSSPIDSGTDKVYSLFINKSAGSIKPQNEGMNRTGGMPIRSFKDISVTPTASWTKLYGTSIESGGIFWNSTDGLISISSDGTTWHTIADKNLGATTVYNYGNTLTDANCGNVFQRGNNYAFPGTKSSTSITTSATQIDASAYGPGNYYSSSTWITTSPWDTSNNGYLRGGATVKEVKNIFIGEYTGWKPNEHTKLYLPLNGDSKDPYNNVTYTWAYGSASYSTWSTGIQAANFTGSNAIGIGTTDLFGSATKITNSVWVTTNTTSGTRLAFAFNHSSPNYFVQIGMQSGMLFGFIGNSGNDGVLYYNTTPATGTKYLITQTIDKDSGTLKLYINGQLVNTKTGLSNYYASSGSQYVGCTRDGGSYYWYGMLRELIVEDKLWTADEVLAYYNKTKVS